MESERDLMLDGNAAAGVLQEIFGEERPDMAEIAAAAGPEDRRDEVARDHELHSRRHSRHGLRRERDKKAAR